MKSKIMKSPFVSKIAQTIKGASADKLTLYAAQSSFYLCVSAIPFVILILSLSRLVAPSLVEDVISLARGALPGGAAELFDAVVDNVAERPALSVVSFSALGLIWASSKGLKSVVRGVSAVYEKKTGGTVFTRAARAAVYTALFVVVMTATLVVLVFGKYVGDAMKSNLGEIPAFVRYKELISFVVLTALFSLVYVLVSKGVFTGRLFKCEKVKGARFRDELPGAAVAAAGWILFSLAYSAYFDSVPRFSYLYGSLAAIVFLMLWLYFCILIFLVGAEINKALRSKKQLLPLEIPPEM